MLLTGPFAMLSMPSFDFATVYGRLPHPPLPTMVIATLAIATISLGGTFSLYSKRVVNNVLILTHPKYCTC